MQGCPASGQATQSSTSHTLVLLQAIVWKYEKDVNSLLRFLRWQWSQPGDLRAHQVWVARREREDHIDKGMTPGIQQHGVERLTVKLQLPRIPELPSVHPLPFILVSLGFPLVELIQCHHI